MSPQPQLGWAASSIRRSVHTRFGSAISFVARAGEGDQFAFAAVCRSTLSMRSRWAIQALAAARIWRWSGYSPPASPSCGCFVSGPIAGMSSGKPIRIVKSPPEA